MDAARPASWHAADALAEHLVGDLARLARRARSPGGLKRVPIVTSRCATPRMMKNAVGVLSSLNPNRNGAAISTAASAKSSSRCAAIGIELTSERRPVRARRDGEHDHAGDDRQRDRGAGLEAEQKRRRDEQDAGEVLDHAVQEAGDRALAQHRAPGPYPRRQ